MSTTISVDTSTQNWADDQSLNQTQNHGQDQEEGVPASQFQDQPGPDADQRQDEAGYDGHQPDQEDHEDQAHHDEQKYDEEQEEVEHLFTDLASQDDDPLASLTQTSISIKDLTLEEIAVYQAVLKQIQDERRRLISDAFQRLAPVLLRDIWKAPPEVLEWALQVIEDHFEVPERDHMVGALEAIIKQRGAAVPLPPPKKPRTPRKPRSKTPRHPTPPMSA